MPECFHIKYIPLLGSLFSSFPIIRLSLEVLPPLCQLKLPLFHAQGFDPLFILSFDVTIGTNVLFVFR